MKFLRITEHEACEIIKAGMVLEAAFGPGWLALQWDESKPMPEIVKFVLSMRGLLNENMDGAGI
jgi:hypothetical protein